MLQASHSACTSSAVPQPFAPLLGVLQHAIKSTTRTYHCMYQCAASCTEGSGVHAAAAWPQCSMKCRMQSSSSLRTSCCPMHPHHKPNTPHLHPPCIHPPCIRLWLEHESPGLRPHHTSSQAKHGVAMPSQHPGMKVTAMNLPANCQGSTQLHYSTAPALQHCTSARSSRAIASAAHQPL